VCIVVSLKGISLNLGVTIWEIFTLGNIPFPNESWDKQFVERIKDGVRMGKPKYADNDM